MDSEVLIRHVAEEYGFRRIGRIIREKVQITLGSRREITKFPKSIRKTVWPLDATPTELLPWEPSSSLGLVDWEELSDPGRAGLVAHVLADSPADVPRAVLELIEQCNLTRRLIAEVEASRVVAERFVKPFSNTDVRRQSGG